MSTQHVGNERQADKVLGASLLRLAYLVHCIGRHEVFRAVIIFSDRLEASIKPNISTLTRNLTYLYRLSDDIQKVLICQLSNSEQPQFPVAV